mmetsp:Transcript_113052/g.365087  ORF Transcript_113052/g.365087 Transcript_113052/m.365087 type:complete len:528 (-) Transcript_113052:78-1661(-)
MRLSWRALRWPGYALLGSVPPTYAWYVSGSGDYCLEGAWRGVFFWSRVGPIVLHYIWVDRTTRKSSAEERGSAFERLHATYAPTALGIILALRGFYVKAGQFASARADIVPHAYLEQFRQLQDQVPHEGLDHVRATIQASLQRPVEEVFAHIQAEPLGAASIGQAHYARLHDGSEVVVKVQYPAVRRTFYLDMSCIRTVACLVEPSLAPVLDELKKQFLTEFDYRGEAQNLRDVADLVLPTWGGCVAMPQPLLEFCGEHTLTMTYLPGEKLEAVLQREWQRLGLRQEDLELQMRASAPPSPRRLALYLRLLRWRATALDLWSLVSATLRRPRGANTGGDEPAAKAEAVTHERIPRRQQLVQTLLGVHAQQVLVNGVFNADLHPGNFLLLPDGRLGLIDYGQVKRIDDETRCQLARLIIAVAREDSGGVVAALTELGVRSKKMDPRFLETTARMLFGRVDGDLTGGRPLPEFLDELRSMDTLTTMPGELYLPSRAAVMLRGLALLLHCHVSVAEEWMPVAERVLSASS